VEDEPYPGLLSEKGGRGFPYLVFMDAEGDVITPQAYGTFTVKDFQETLGNVSELRRLEELAKKGDKSADTPLFIAKVKLGRYNFAEASAKRKKLPSESVAQKKEIDDLLFDLQISSIMGKVNGRRPDSFDTAKGELQAIKKAGGITKEQAEKLDDELVGLDVGSVLSKIRDKQSQTEAIQKLLAMRKAGRTPKKGRIAGTFWFLIMNHAFQEEDADLAEEAFNGVKKAHGSSIRKDWVEKTQERLNELKEKGKQKGEDKDK
jgi:hypothetical protein